MVSLIKMMLVRIWCSCIEGCPDADEDGSRDKEDKCPTLQEKKTQAVSVRLLMEMVF
jgi:hypothetical protein